MITKNISTKFTPLQHELLKLYSFNIPENDLLAIRDLIGKYFLDRLQEKVNTAVDKFGYTQDDFDSWLNDPKQ